jgi:hypothetical protein
MVASLAFATTLFLLLATACRPSGKPAAPHRSPTTAPVLSLTPVLVIFIVAQRYFAWSVAATGRGREVSPGRAPQGREPWAPARCRRRTSGRAKRSRQ